MAIATRAILPSRTDKLDLNDDGFTDLVWQGKDGSMVVWYKDASGLYGVGSAFIPNPGNGYSLRATGDWNGSGGTDFVWQNEAGATQTWTMRENQMVFVADLPPSPPIQAVGDFDGNGHTDLLWQNSDGSWFTASAEARKIPPIGLGQIAPPVDQDFQLVGVGDFDGDGRDGLLFRGTGDDAGSFLIQEPVSVAPRPGQVPVKPISFGDPGADWSVLAIGDFNGDRKADIAWQHTNGAGEVDARSIWLMDGGRIIGGDMLYNPGIDWEIRGSGDYNNDGKTDLLAFHKPSGWYAEYLIDGAQVAGFGASMPTSGDFWTLGAV